MLARHFALNKNFRTNLYYNTTVLYTDDKSVACRCIVKREDEDNPLMMSGMLLTALAVECYHGSTYALKVIKKASTAISDLYKFSGNSFDGYVLRGDPVTRDDGQDKIKFIDPQTGQK